MNWQEELDMISFSKIVTLTMNIYLVSDKKTLELLLFRLIRYSRNKKKKDIKIKLYSPAERYQAKIITSIELILK